MPKTNSISTSIKGEEAVMGQIPGSSSARHWSPALFADFNFGQGRSSFNALISAFLQS
jgi:hypothetical protein